MITIGIIKAKLFPDSPRKIAKKMKTICVMVIKIIKAQIFQRLKLKARKDLM
jgi:hypothetical protein